MRATCIFRNPRYLSLITLAALIVSTPALAAPESANRADQAVPQYVFRSFRQAEGLDNLAITALSIDSRGFLWVGTQNGLYRFIGSAFQRFGPVEGIPETTIEDVLAAPDGSVWVGTLKNLYRWTGERFVPAAPKPIHAWRSGRMLAEAPGRLLVVDGDRLFRLTYRLDGSLASYQSALPDTPQSAQAIGSLTLANRTLWFGCGSKLCSSSPESTLIEWGTARGFPEEYCYSLQFDVHGSLWIVTEHHILELPPGAARFLDRTPSGSDPKSVYHRQPIARDPQGRIIVSTGRYLARWEGSAWMAIGPSNGMTFGHINELAFDSSGDLWMGSAGQGLHHWTGYNNWEGWSSQQGLPSSDVWSPGSFAPGLTVVGTELGPASINSATGLVTPLFSSREWAYGQVGGVVSDRKGALWTGTKSGSILRIDPGSRHATLVADLPAVVLGMMAEPSGHILVFTKKGMFGFDPPASPNRLPDVLPVRAANAATGGPQRISNGCAAPDGSLWFATRGVLRLHHDSWSLSPITGMAVKNKTWQGMACAPDGTLFLISRENEILHLTPRNGNLEARSILLPEDYRSLALVAILSGSDGVLWLGTDDGLLAWNGSSWRHLTQESGLIWNDVNSGGLSLAPDGAIWIGTSAGVGRLVHPEHMFDAVSLPLSLTNIRHGAKQLPVIEAALPWSRSSMSFEFAVPTVLNRSDLTFSYRIAQLDPAWLETRDASAHFASLAPGSYDFQVFARNRALNATSPITTFRFSILPPWWRTSWFYCLCGLALLGFLFLLYELRTRHLLHQRKTLEEEVRNRTLELEESRSELLAQATHDGLTGLMNRSAILNALAAELARAQREKIALTVVLADVDHFKRVNDTHGHLAGDTALRRFAEALFYSTRTYDLAGRYGGEEFLILLPGISSEQAAERLADLHISISSVAVHHQSRLFEITCSCGALSIDPGQANLEPDEALAGADRALYEAKAKGRDRVVHHVFSSEPVFKGI